MKQNDRQTDRQTDLLGSTGMRCQVPNNNNRRVRVEEKREREREREGERERWKKGKTREAANTADFAGQQHTRAWLENTRLGFVI